MKKIFLLSFLLFGSYFMQSQLVYEYEVDLGYSIFQGDYGMRGDFNSTLGNNGFLLGGKAYFDLLNGSVSNCYACKHFKFPLGFNLGYSNLNFNKVDLDLSSSEAIKLKAFSGNVFQTLLSFGFEYHIGDLNTFSFGNESFFQKVDPYFGASVGGAVYAVKLKSELGDFEANPTILPKAFQGGIYDKPGISPLVLFEGGVRFKLSESLNLNLNGKWIYYMSDKVDGLVPNPVFAENIYNDWQFAPSIGVVFQLLNSGFYSQR